MVLMGIEVCDIPPPSLDCRRIPLGFMFLELIEVMKLYMRPDPCTYDTSYINIFFWKKYCWCPLWGVFWTSHKVKNIIAINCAIIKRLICLPYTRGNIKTMRIFYWDVDIPTLGGIMIQFGDSSIVETHQTTMVKVCKWV